MAPPEKRNQFLDAEDSDDDVVQDNSDDELQKGGRTAKRRKVEDDSDFDSNDDDATDAGFSDDDDDEEEETTRAGKGGKSEKPAASDATGEPAGEAEKKKNKEDNQPADIRLVKPMTRKNLVATEAAIKKSGVVYLSRIPPFMKPQKLRSLLETYGKINRVFLSPQDPTAHTRRVRAGGNRKKMYTEGWVEFVSKRDAKSVCGLLNAQTVGGKKGTYYRDDIWSLKYLRGFKWHHLTEQIATESAERSSRMMAEIMREKRDNKDFVQKVERAKVLDGMQNKKAKRKNAEEDGGAEAKPAVVEAAPAKTRNLKFKQTSLAPKREAPSQPEQAKKALSKIF